MQARYADGRAAVFADVDVTLTPEKLFIRHGDRTIDWAYTDLARSDDKNGRIVLRRKRKPDSGERLMLGEWYDDELKAVAPHLLKPRAQGMEGRLTIAALVTLSWSLAGAFLIGIPYAADPMSRAMPEKYRTQIADISWTQVNNFTAQCHLTPTTQHRSSTNWRTGLWSARM